VLPPSCKFETENWISSATLESLVLVPALGRDLSWSIWVLIKLMALNLLGWEEELEILLIEDF
jgi:hypothetical protein